MNTAKKPSGGQSAGRYRTVILTVLAMLVLVFAASLAIGRYSVPFIDTFKIFLAKIIPMEHTWESMAESIVTVYRLPRTVAAVMVGATLALSGACYQSIFKNPMVSPDLLGVSSGACIGAAVMILLDASALMIQLGAFVCGLIAVGITMTIPRLVRNESTTVLVLSGVVVSSLMSSIMSIIKFVADPDTKLAEITYWSMGSFANLSMGEIGTVIPTVALPCIVILLMRYRLNVLSLGDNEARSLGLNLRRTRGAFILCSTLATASCVCLAGNVGWVGLVIPHTARMLAGSDNKRMLPAAMLLGAVFMLVIDILCRTISSAELKLGILTGVIGAPFFIFILIKQNRNLT